MSKIDKKEIRKSLDEAIAQVLQKLTISNPSKKLEKISKAFSKKFADEVKDFLKKKSPRVDKGQKMTARKVAKKGNGKGPKLKSEK